MSPTPPPMDVFWCPACGQKHRGDLQSVRGGGVLRAKCAGCGIQLAVGWADGKAVVKRAEPEGVPAAAAAVTGKSGAPARTVPPGLLHATPEAALFSASRVTSSQQPTVELPPPDAPVAPIVVAAPAASGTAVAPAATAAAPLPAAPAAPAKSVPPARAEAASPARAEAGSPARAEAGSPARAEAVSPARAEAGSPARADVGPPAAATAAAAGAPAAELVPGTQVGRYKIEEPIGSGGTGTVYRAYDAVTNRYVALKLINRDQSDSMRTRFLREIEVQANLRHAHLMPVFDRGEHDGRPYFTMELLYRPFTLTEIVTMSRDGMITRYATLRHLDRTEKLVSEVLLPICDAMQVANVENGVVHRDLKPDNVLVDSRTLRPYVIDFGICQVLERRSRVSKVVVAPTGDDAGIVGTPRFLAPEQARGAVHERTDVWGLGAILYYCLTGEAPIAAASPITRIELRRRIDALREAETVARRTGDETKADLCADKLSRLEDAGVRSLDDLFDDAREGRYAPLPSSVPAGLAAITRKAMAARTAERYASPRALASDLQTWLSGSSTRAMTEQGSAAQAVVQGVQSAVRRHLVTGIAALLVGGAAFMLGRSLAGGGGGGPTDSAGVAILQDLDGLDRRAAAVGRSAREFTPRDAARVYDVLHGDLAGMRESIAAMPAGGTKSSLEERLRAVADRFAPGRVKIVLPEGSGKARFEDVVRGGDFELAAGEAPLAPGEYRVEAAGARIPLLVPLIHREPGEPADREPARWTIEVPAIAGGAPAEMALVVPGVGEVEHRGPPWSAPSTFAVHVGPFLMDRREVRNRDWLLFLESIKDTAERKRRMPPLDFQPDPERPGSFLLFEASRDLPVRGITVEDAIAYCTWRSAEEGATVRLPTEAEWVVAAGGLLRHDIANGARGLREEGDLTAPVPVSSLRDADRSPYGVFGLFGNVREIVTGVRVAADAPDAFMTKGAGPGDDPSEAAIRKVRPIAKDAHDPRVGFRCVRELK
ncbi:MAG TPA: bifunctional serine/threonine-protein kinase/formylglycine-generating enzyme family protein [Planctomycetota bacterium]|nr:bifunctional serine/threonine-protein kinase/formylglycine-generating enzyme family protein [Planctomycetota bacterium]